MKSKDLIYISVGLFYLLLFSMEAWFLARIPTWFTGVLEVLLIIKMQSYVSRGSYQRMSKSNVGIILCLLIAIFWNHMSSIGITISCLLSIAVMCSLLNFSEEDQIAVLSHITKWFSILLTISVTAWLVHFVVPLPSYGSVYRAGELINSVNFGLFVEAPYDPFRFKSVFLEPGHVSMIATFFVAANRFNFRNPYVLLLSLCIIPTFGLSGYVLFVIGYALYSIESGKVSTIFKRIVPIAIIFTTVILYYQSYNGGDNLFNELIMNRLEYDNERVIVGNDRSSFEVDRAFDEALKNGRIISGISKTDYLHIFESGGRGAGAKVYILQHGIIGAFFLLLAYYLISKKSRYRRWATFMFLLYFASFFQRVYFFWAAYYIPFICSMSLPPKDTTKN